MFGIDAVVSSFVYLKSFCYNKIASMPPNHAVGSKRVLLSDITAHTLGGSISSSFQRGIAKSKHSN